MKRPAFRSVDNWKSALMNLPDNGFFELLRSIFGNIKTPFSKQKLLDDLFNLLSRDEIRKTIAAYLDKQDHKIIAAIVLLCDPTPGELESFFASELGGAEINNLVLNLEERLIVYRYKADDVMRMSLNPVLEKVLEPLVADTGVLFQSLPIGRGSQERSAAASSFCITDSRILASLFAFLYSYNEEEPLRAETETQFRGLRKKVLDDGKKIFPNLDLELVVRSLLHLELFYTEACSLLPSTDRIVSFSNLPTHERNEYWAAAVYLCLSETDPAPPDVDYMGNLTRNRLRKIASVIHRFMSLIDSERKYPEITLRRILELISREDGNLGNVWGSRLFDDRIRLPFEPFLAALEKSGHLEKMENCWRLSPSYRRDPAELSAKITDKSSPKEEKADAPVIVMDTAFSFILYPEISFADALALASFCSVKIPNGPTVCFELTRESAVRGFDQDMKADAMLELLTRLSLNRLDENLAWTIKDWENRYAGVLLQQGIVLSLAEDRRYLAEARPLASMISQTLAPGVYLLSSGDKPEIIKALRKAGVDIIAQPPSIPQGSDQRYLRSFTSRSYLNSFHRLGTVEPLASPLPASKPNGNPEEKPVSETDSIKQKFRRTLENMKIGKPERDELEARIERRLILSDSQLDGASIRYEKLEARGLDYTGKTSIAKQAIEMGALLDVSWPGPGGTTRQILAVPLSLEKKEKESILVMKSPEGGGSASETIRIPLGKISLLRRIKQSIFGE